LQVVKTLLHLVKTVTQPNSHRRHVITLVHDVLQVYDYGTTRFKSADNSSPSTICQHLQLRWPIRRKSVFTCKIGSIKLSAKRRQRRIRLTPFTQAIRLVVLPHSIFSFILTFVLHRSYHLCFKICLISICSPSKIFNFELIIYALFF